MTRPLRRIAAPFVVAPPTGARVRTRLFVSEHDETVLHALGRHLGSLASSDLARRCQEGRLDAKERAQSRRDHKRTLTTHSTSRWAGAITRTSEDAYQLAMRNLYAEARSLRARMGRIRRRLAVPVGGRRGRLRGYTSQAERFAKVQRLQVLGSRLGRVEARIEAGAVSICRGGKRLVKARHNLADAKLTEEEWLAKWESARYFLTADGEAGKSWGNETVRWSPEEAWLEAKLPVALSRLANRPHGRYRLSCAVAFGYRGDEVAAQAATGAVRYDISYDPVATRWYLDASWKMARAETPAVEELASHQVLAVDLNSGHLACIVVDPSGNPVGKPSTIRFDLEGEATTRDGHLRGAISQLINIARDSHCAAIVIEDLDFAEAREEGRERSGRRPSRGKRGRAFRRTVSDIPTAKFRDRLVQMATNAGLTVIAVDPAYTSKWGAEHWLTPLTQQFSPKTTLSGHHAAALVIGRRALGQRARRRGWCDGTRPEDREPRATDSAVWAIPAPAGLSGKRQRKPGNHKTRGQPHLRQKTRQADRTIPGDQDGEDRSRRPEEVMSYSLLL